MKSNNVNALLAEKQNLQMKMSFNVFFKNTTAIATATASSTIVIATYFS